MKRYNGLSSRQWMNQAVDMLAEIRRKTTCPVLLIPHVMMPPRVFPDNDDYLFLPRPVAEVVARFAGRRSAVRFARPLQQANQVGDLQAASLCGARLHSTIAALSSCVPTFTIGHSVKSKGINLDLFGHEQWIAHVSQLSSAGQLAERVQSLLEQETAVRSHLRSIIPDYANTAWRNGEFLQSLLRERE